MTKLAQKEKARQLRLEGWAITAIAVEVGVAKSSVSTWVRDLPQPVEFTYAYKSARKQKRLEKLATERRSKKLLQLRYFNGATGKWQRGRVRGAFYQILSEKSEPNGSYTRVYLPAHPHSDKKGRIYLHRAVMENYLGRYLSLKEVVHHENEDPTDNRISNLRLMLYHEHVGHHSAERGVPLLRLTCPQCGKEFERAPRKIRGKRCFCTRRCVSKFYASIMTNRRVGRTCGTTSAYRGGCRCAACKAANTEAMAKYRARKRSGW